MVLHWRCCIRVISCNYFAYQKFFNIKLTWVLRGMMDVFHVYCFKSVGIYKHKLSRIDSLVILYLLGNKVNEMSGKLHLICSKFGFHAKIRCNLNNISYPCET